MSYKSFDELGNKPKPNRDLYSVLTVENAQHKNQIITQNRVVVVDIYADWCRPCKQIEPEYSMMAQKYNQQGQVMLIKENLQKKITQGITGVPTFHFFVDGQLVDQEVGADLRNVDAKLQKILNTRNAPVGGLQGPPSHTGGMNIRGHVPVYHGHSVSNNPHDQSNQQPYQGDGAIYHQPHQNGAAPQYQNPNNPQRGQNPQFMGQQQF
jgi:thioredoxin 1